MKNLIAIAIGLLLASTSYGQQIRGLTVQQPTVSQFGISTAVSVPDGGAMYLGGVPSTAASSIRRPGSRGIGRSIAAPGVSVSARLIIGSEVQAELDRRGRLAPARKARPQVHGTAAEKAKAAFIARNLGRASK